MTLHQQLIKEINEGDLFEFLCKKGHELKQSDLLTLAKECAYAATDIFKRNHKFGGEEMLQNWRNILLENLPEYWNENDEDSDPDAKLHECYICHDTISWGGTSAKTGALIYSCENIRCNETFCTACKQISDEDEKVLCPKCTNAT